MSLSWDFCLRLLYVSNVKIITIQLILGSFRLQTSDNQLKVVEALILVDFLWRLYLQKIILKKFNHFNYVIDTHTVRCWCLSTDKVICISKWNALNTNDGCNSVFNSSTKISWNLSRKSACRKLGMLHSLTLWVDA